MILGNAVLNFCVCLFIIHHKLIRFKTSLITRNNEHFELVIMISSELKSGFQFKTDRNDEFIKHQKSYEILCTAGLQNRNDQLIGTSGVV